MSCPTCDHTMQRVADDCTVAVFWCPRCGTLCEDHGKNGFASAPKLVERCRKFEPVLFSNVAAVIATAWRRDGIAECIRPPEGMPA